MGFFTRDRIVDVQASAQSLGDDWKKRPNLMTAMIVDQTLFNTHPSFGDAYLENFVYGITKDIRSYPRKAKEQGYYGITGQSQQAVTIKNELPLDLIKDAFGASSITAADQGPADASMWVEQALMGMGERYIAANYRNIYDVTSTSAMIRYPKEGNASQQLSMKVIFEQPYSSSGTFLYAMGINPGGFTDTGEAVLETAQYDTPPSNWSLSDTYIEINTTIITEVERNGSVTTDTTPTRTIILTGSEILTEREFIENTGYYSVYNVHLRTRSIDYELVDDVQVTQEMLNGVLVTTTVTRRVPKYTYVEDSITTVEYDATGGRTGIYIYKKGTGNPGLDDIMTAGTSTGMYYPVVPLRIDIDPGEKGNPKYVDKSFTHVRGLYAANKKVTKKVLGKRGYDSLLKSVEEGFVDAYDKASEKDKEGMERPAYSTILFGATINTTDPLAQRYIWEFLDNEYNKSNGGANTALNELTASIDAANKAAEDYYNNFDREDDEWEVPEGEVNTGPPSPSLTEYERTGYPPSPTQKYTSLTLRTSSAINFSYQLRWLAITRKTGTGQGKQHATTRSRSTHTIPMKQTVVSQEIAESRKGLFKGIYKALIKDITVAIPTITFRKWVTNTEWVEYTLYDPRSDQIIHWGKAHTTTLDDAFDKETTPQDSTLIIPLNTEAFRDMKRVPATHLGIGSAFLLNAYYSDRRQAWWETGFFKFLVFVAVLAVTVYLTPAGGTGVGKFVAGALGLTGAAATIMAVVTNYVVAIMITKMVGWGAKKLFGDVWGELIAAVVAIVIMQGLDNFANFGTFNILDAFTPDKLLRYTDAVFSTVTAYQQAELKKLNDKFNQDKQMFEEMQAKLDEAFDSMFKPSIAVDFTKFADATNTQFEPLDQFIARTSMVGSEIAEISLKSLEISLDLQAQLELA